MKCPNCHRKFEDTDCEPCGKSNTEGDWCSYYMPSNGSEGEWFHSEFCDNCINQNPDPEKKPQCDEVLLESLLGNQPKEWVYTEDRKPTCTAFVKWDWNNDGDPPEPEPENPNQLTILF